MITDVAKKIPTQRIEQLRAEANVANAEQTARMVETQSTHNAQAEHQMKAEPSVAMATLHNTLDAQPKHTLKQGIVKCTYTLRFMRSWGMFLGTCFTTLQPLGTTPCMRVYRGTRADAHGVHVTLVRVMLSHAEHADGHAHYPPHQ